MMPLSTAISASITRGTTTWAPYRVRTDVEYASRVAVVAARANRPIRSEVRFFSCASAARVPSNDRIHSGIRISR